MGPIKRPTKAAIETSLSAYYGEADEQLLPRDLARRRWCQDLNCPADSSQFQSGASHTVQFGTPKGTQT